MNVRGIEYLTKDHKDEIGSIWQLDPERSIPIPFDIRKMPSLFTYFFTSIE